MAQAAIVVLDSAADVVDVVAVNVDDASEVHLRWTPTAPDVARREAAQRASSAEASLNAPLTHGTHEQPMRTWPECRLWPVGDGEG